MPGAFQVWNAALAAVAIKNRFPEITEEQIEQGLSSAKLPGRFEVAHFEIKGNPVTIVFDGAHTVNSLSFTLENFYRYFGAKADILFACAADKKMVEMSHLVCSSNCAFSSITVTRPGKNKQSNYEGLLTAFSSSNIAQGGKSPAILNGNPDYLQAINEALNLAAFRKKTLLVSGSFYLVAEVKKLLAQTTVPVA